MILAASVCRWRQALLILRFSKYCLFKRGGGRQWRTEGGVGVEPPPPEIPKALENRAKLNPIVKTVKNG